MSKITDSYYLQQARFDNEIEGLRWLLPVLHTVPQGLFHLCENQLTPGLSCDGGYAEYVIMCHPALINILSELSSVHAASVFCAGTASFNALRTSGAMAGDKVATYPSDCQGYQRWRDDHWTSMSGRVCLIHSLLVPWCRLNKDARSIRIDD